MGMTCQACANRLEKVLNKNPLVDMAQVNFATETLTIRHKNADSQDVVAWISKAGFEGVLVDELKPADKVTIPYQLLVLWLISLPFWVGMFGMMIKNHALMPSVWVQFVLSSIVQFVFGWRFYRGAWSSLRAGLANMDVLIALGTTAIWLYSTYVWLFHVGRGTHEMVYFEASVMVIAFVSLGKYLEARTKQDGLNSLSLLMGLIPNTTSRKNNKTWQTIDVESVKVGDVLLARVGERIAVDGVLTVGVGLVDEAHLTGESEHLPKMMGDTVLAGSIVIDGGFEYQATATGNQTALGDMITALNEAQSTKADITRLTDKIAGIFVPAVVLVAFVVFVFNWLILGVFDAALMRAVSVLVIACPCALGLATPAAIMAGMGVAARHGVRFKDASSLEMAGRIDTMVFDKTGTLTVGKPTIRAVLLADGFAYDDVLTIVASLEQQATHPLAKSIVKSALDKGLNLHSASCSKTIIGEGLMGDVGDVGMVKVGTPKFVGLTNFNHFIKNQPVGFKTIHIDDDNKHGTSEAIWETASIVAVSVNDKLIAIYALSDTPKSDAKQVIHRLQKDGICVIMMSGDRQGVVDDVAGGLGIHQAYGHLSPRDKSIKINNLKKSGSIVAMVGDGVNDAPAMASAQVSFSVRDASSIAKYAASAELIGDCLAHAYYAQKIAKATLKNIKQNLFFACIYNVFGIVFAALGLLNPIVAAAAMALSSICVLVNALRLKRFDIKNDFEINLKNKYQIP